LCCLGRIPCSWPIFPLLYSTSAHVARTRVPLTNGPRSSASRQRACDFAVSARWPPRCQLRLPPNSLARTPGRPADLAARTRSDSGRCLGIKPAPQPPGTQAIAASRISSSSRIHLRPEYCWERIAAAMPRSTVGTPNPNTSNGKSTILRFAWTSSPPFAKKLRVSGRVPGSLEHQ
jgi:hypothetical protein